MNGDGYPDLAVGVPGEAPRRRRAGRPHRGGRARPRRLRVDRPGERRGAESGRRRACRRRGGRHGPRGGPRRGRRRAPDAR
ncbi:FG-GAP repeat protein [Streptomyces sp. NPDC005534]|uniref:FG-GAP repeat protein n=1 Tax=Streptomyces sp. NPDC005534 TaxID=3155714 RepID=UPI0034552E5E